MSDGSMFIGFKGECKACHLAHGLLWLHYDLGVINIWCHVSISISIYVTLTTLQYLASSTVTRGVLQKTSRIRLSRGGAHEESQRL